MKAKIFDVELAGMEDTCKWRNMDDNELASVWYGDCGIDWMLDSDGPAENGMIYCPQCGRVLEVN